MLHIACDVHTHTIYSRHAYSTVEENVRAAAERRIELLGCTDHYGRLVYAEHEGRFYPQDYQYFSNYGCWPRVWHGVRLLRGVEADIVDLEGNLFGHDIMLDYDFIEQPFNEPRPLKDVVFSTCDYVIASVHNKGFTQGASVAQNTRAYVGALEDPKVLALGHIGRTGLRFDTDAILAVARDLGKLIEINEHSFDSPPDAHERCRRIAIRCAETGTMISTGTDAHISHDIGAFDRTLAMLEEIHFPQRLIATRDAETFLSVVEKAVGRPRGL